jgi:hypothetical protein
MDLAQAQAFFDCPGVAGVGSNRANRHGLKCPFRARDVLALLPRVGPAAHPGLFSAGPLGLEASCNLRERLFVGKDETPDFAGHPTVGCPGFQPESVALTLCIRSKGRPSLVPSKDGTPNPASHPTVGCPGFSRKQILSPELCLPSSVLCLPSSVLRPPPTFHVGAGRQQVRLGASQENPTMRTSHHAIRAALKFKSPQSMPTR